MKKVKKIKAKPRLKKASRAKAKKIKKIALFGGTFDPIHYGHLNSIEMLEAQLKFDEIFVVPANQNPFRQNTRVTEGRHRLEMVRRALSDPSRFSNVKVISDEIDKGGVSYTVETIRVLKAKLREAEFYLCVGADQLSVFDQWRDYKKILALANLVVTTRPGHDLARAKANMPAWLQEELVNFRFPRGRLKSKKSIQFVSLQDIDVSASEIRRRARRSESIEHLTPAAVVQYIAEQKIYTPQDRKVENYREFTKFCAKVAIDHGALQVQGYDLRELTQPAEFALVATGTSARHTRSLSESIVKEAREQFDIYPQSTEGVQQGRWVIVDYGTLMIHIFFDYVRSEYRIEDLWAGAKRIE